jgi:Recombinase zinc beta ribbon domain
MTSTRHRRTPLSDYRNYYRCRGRRDKGKDTCSQAKGVRAEAAEGMVWDFVSGLLTDPEQLRADLDAMIRFERDTARDAPEHEAKAWLNKLAELENKRSRFQDMAAEGLITFDELREKLLALEENRETARRELEALDRRQERIEELERDRDALLDSLVAVSPDALEALASQERLNLYQMLGLRVVLRQDGGLEASGTLMDTPSVCTPTAARA